MAQKNEDMEEQKKEFVASIPTLNVTDINEHGNCPSIYNQSWSDTLNDIACNFCRKNGILSNLQDIIIPKSVFDVIAKFMTNDITKYRSFKDYVNAILICKYFTSLKHTSNPNNENDRKLKETYKLTKRGVLTANKIFKALKNYKANEFKIFNDNNIENFEILFIDHLYNKYNLQQYSYPNNIIYNISSDELKIITAIRDAIKYNMNTKNETNDYKVVWSSKVLTDIIKKGNFKSGKKSIRLHTIIEYRNKALFAIDYSFSYSYFLFVFKYFTIIIHDELTTNTIIQRTMEARVIANRYREILEQFDQSGL